MGEDILLALDQGTTSTRAIAFTADLQPRATARRELAQYFPHPGWVEHDPEEIWTGSLAVLREVLLRTASKGGRMVGLGITNQRETVLLWERANGRCLGRAIVWQDRRTAAQCQRLRAEGVEPLLVARTGLLADPYFSATKLAWMLDQIPAARSAAERGELACGTVDCFLIWRLTGGRVHATDATNASRTLLFDIRRGVWDEDLLRLFRIPAAILPEVRDCAADYGVTAPGLFGTAIPIRGVAGDQQAACIGQACFRPGMVKATYGTGGFALLNLGPNPITSRQRLLTTIAYRFGGSTTYALEGSIFIAGAIVQWLRDGLGIITDATEAEALAATADPAHEVVFVPAFTGLGAPYWDAAARGAIFGLTRGSGRAELCRAALEAVAFQTRDLIAAMGADWSAMTETVLRVNGGMARSDWTMQAIADLLGAPVDRPACRETTARGAAYLAGFAAGIVAGPAEGAQFWRQERRFLPTLPRAEADRRYMLWQEAVRRTRSQ